MAHDVFISHSSKDKTTADAICHSLEQNGIRCWIAPRDVRGGHTYATEIIEGIEGCSVMVLVFSKNSNISEDVANEIQNAFSNGKAIIPYRLDDTKMTKEMQYFLSRKHWIEAYPNDKVFTELVTEVKKSLGKGDVSVTPTPPPLTTRPKWLTPTVAVAAVLVVCVAAILVFGNRGSVPDTSNDDGSLNTSTNEIVSSTDSKVSDSPSTDMQHPADATAGNTDNQNNSASQSQSPAATQPTMPSLEDYSGELTAASWITADDEWLYFEWDEKLCKINRNGEGLVELTNNTPSQIWLKDNKIYFTNAFRDNHIYTINKDGTDRSQYGELVALKVVTAAEGIYTQFSAYMAPGARNNFIKWEDLETFTDWYSDSKEYFGDDFCVYDGNIYYPNYREGGELFKFSITNYARMEGETIRISEDRVKSLQQMGGRIYYLNEDDGNALYSVNPDGTNREKIITLDISYNYWAFSYIVDSDAVYFYTDYGTDLNAFYRYNLKSQSLDKLMDADFINDSYISGFSVIGEWIYIKYNRWVDNVNYMYLTRLKTDGSEYEYILESN